MQLITNKSSHCLITKSFFDAVLEELPSKVTPLNINLSSNCRFNNSIDPAFPLPNRERFLNTLPVFSVPLPLTYNYLSRKGFSYGIAKDAFDQLRQDREEY